MVQAMGCASAQTSSLFYSSHRPTCWLSLSVCWGLPETRTKWSPVQPGGHCCCHVQRWQECRKAAQNDFSCFCELEVHNLFSLYIHSMPEPRYGVLVFCQQKGKKKVTVSQVAFSYSAICFNAGTHLCSLAAEDLQKRLTKANLANHIMNDHGLLGIHVDIECVR